MATSETSSAVGRRSASDADWLLPMAAIAALQFAAWYAMWSAGFARRPLVGLYDVIAIAGLVIGLVPFTLYYLLRVHREGERRPLARIRRDVELPRVAAVGAAMLLGPVTAGAFSAMKGAIAVAVPFYLDPPLARLDRALFGTDPWRLTHALFGWATPAIDMFYLSWLLVMLLGFYLVLLSRPSPRKTQSLVAYLLMWPLVGTIGGYALSSAGPIFQDALFGGHSGLIASLQHEGATKALDLQQRLLAAYMDRYEMPGAGISAMPSMHIAMACWLALTLRAAFPRFQWVGWTYLVLIWFGSVHLGWHYVSDGVVGIIGALLVWKWTPLFVRLLRWPSPSLRGAQLRAIDEPAAGEDGFPDPRALKL
jgi:hypothetical protein